jgi:hypothetical protein
MANKTISFCRKSFRIQNLKNLSKQQITMKKLLVMLLLPIAVFGQYTIQNNTKSVTILPNSIQTTKTNDNDGTSVAIGQDALKSNYSANTWGRLNVALGYRSLYNNGIGATNTSQASSNTALGGFALYANTVGFGNIAIGTSALSSNISGTGNIAIGNSAGYEMDDSYKLYIHPFATPTPLIWGDFSTQLLDIHGKVGIQTKTPIDLLNIHDSNAIPQSYVRFTSNLTGQTANDGFKIGITEFNAGMIFNYENNPLFFGTNGLSRMIISENGNVGINSDLPDTKLVVNGYTKLGSDAPKIKMKEFYHININPQPLRTASNEGGVITYDMGINSTKILAINVFVDYNSVPFTNTVSDDFIPPSYTSTNGYQFDYVLNGNIIEIKNHPTNSENILDKYIKILVTYKE